MELKRPLNWQKNKITKIEKKLTRNYKTLSKVNVNKFVTRNVFCDLLSSVFAKESSALERCPLHRVFVMRV